MKYVYCARWNKKLSKPIEPLTEEQARARFNGEVPEPSHWFTVAAFRNDRDPVGAPEFYLEVLPGATYVNTTFVDQHGSIHFIYGFRLIDDRLFLEDILEYKYPDMSKFYRQGDCTVLETFKFQPTGLVHRTVDDNTSEFIQTNDIRDVDVSNHWEPVPEFGQWESLGRFDR